MSTDLLTAGMAAERIGTRKRNIYNWFHKGLLPGVRIGPKSIFFRAADVDRLVADVNRAQPQPQPYDVPLPIDDAESARRDYEEGNCL